MKKLVFMLALIATAGVANAASFSWSATRLFGPDGTTGSLAGATAYLYCSALSETPLTSANIAVDNTVLGGYVDFSGSVNVASATASTDYGFYMEIITTYAGTEYKFTSGVTTVTTPPADALITSVEVGFGNLKADTQNTANWTAVNVPEPTSGLLLLLGMAGLALRRKKA